MQNILFEDRITESLLFLSVVIHWTSVSSYQLPSFNFILLSHRVPVYPFPTSMFFSHNCRQKTGVGRCPMMSDCSMFLSSCPQVCQTKFLLLLPFAARLIQSAQSITPFFLWPGKIHLPIKEHK